MVAMPLNRRISTRSRVLGPPAVAGALLLSRYSRISAQAKVRHTTWASSPAEQELYETVLDDLRVAIPNLELDYEPITSDYDTKLQTDIAAGTVADVFWINDILAPDIMAPGQLLALDDYMAASGISTDDYFPALIQAFQWQGKTYGLPKDFSTLAMVYDKKVLGDAGIANAPTNWQELTDAGQAILDTTGQPGVMIQSTMDRYLPFHYSAGAEVMSEDGSQIVVDSPEAEQALEFYYGMYRDGIATTPADAGAQWPGDGMAKGLAAIVFEGNWLFPFLKENAPDLDFGIAEMPDGPVGKATLAFTVCDAAFVDTPVPDDAWAVIEYLCGPEGMTKWTSLGLAMPTRKDLADTWADEFPERQPFIAGGDYARRWQFGVGGQAFNSDANTQLQGLFAGELDVATALKEIKRVAEERIQLAPMATPAG
jgi:multiple sugar transport system substrate-binding protein